MRLQLPLDWRQRCRQLCLDFEAVQQTMLDVQNRVRKACAMRMQAELLLNLAPLLHKIMQQPKVAEAVAAAAAPDAVKAVAMHAASALVTRRLDAVRDCCCDCIMPLTGSIWCVTNAAGVKLPGDMHQKGESSSAGLAGCRGPTV